VDWNGEGRATYGLTHLRGIADRVRGALEG
jgi:hypothetical protein